MRPAMGYVSQSPKQKRARQIGVHVHPASRKQQRACITHVAFICDNAEIQTRLPHVFIGNQNVLTAKTVRRLQSQTLNSNVFLWRRKSAWVNDLVLIEILELLRKALEPFQARYQAILLWDALKSHLSPRVLRAAARAALWTIIVPAKLTWLLQPADTHCFAKYKAFLRKRYLEMSSDTSTGTVSLEEILLSMNAAVRLVFQKTRWAESFTQNGFGDGQQRVRRAILEHLQWSHCPTTPKVLPSLSGFVAVWPQRLNVPIDALFAAFLPQARPARRQNSNLSDAAADDDTVEWSQRLRPRLSEPHARSAVAAPADQAPARVAGPPRAIVPCHPPPAPPPAARVMRARPPIARPIASCRR